MSKRILRIIWTVLSYLLVAAIAATVTLLAATRSSGKLTQLRNLIDQVYVEEVNWEEVEDAAAWAMVEALPDDWSYYVSASEYAAYIEDKENRYVGVGITVQRAEDGTGYDILQVEPGGGASQAGVRPGDVLVQVDGKPVEELTVNEVAALVQGEENTTVTLGIRRDGQVLQLQVVRSLIQVQVATATMLEGNIGYVTIANFNETSADQTIAAIEELVSQGAKALIFDVRNNPGGYKSEMVQVLDYLLPSGELFRSVDYQGKTQVDRSGASCLELPMAVLINENSYSAAEFFAAALEEYDWAVTVGQPTVGKGHYQVTYDLSDGSAVALSVGKYYTPKGVSLADTGGLVPNVAVTVDEQTAALIYSAMLEPAEDPQLQAAVAALQ